MVNTELYFDNSELAKNYNILNIVVNTEHSRLRLYSRRHYNILNIVVNTELILSKIIGLLYYNILNIVVNTELMMIIYL